jgi:hypothetical protein
VPGTGLACLARTFRLQRTVHILGQLSSEDLNTVTTSPDPTEIDPATRRKLAVDLFNRTWALLKKSDRTTADDDEMIHGAHASRYHWGEAEGGGPVNRARGEWQCSRVYAVLGRSEPAMWHARRCLAICESNGIADWDIASAYEAMARANLAADDLAQVAAWKAKGVAALDAIADRDDRELIESDLATLP